MTMENSEEVEFHRMSSPHFDHGLLKSSFEVGTGSGLGVQSSDVRALAKG